ncbi:MAG: hypothetical protein Fur007_14070 [Rhodoferax sp.]
MPSKRIPWPAQLLPDQRIQLGTLGDLRAQFFGDLPHLGGKGFIVVLNRFGAHTTAGSEHVAVLGKLSQSKAAAKAGVILIVAGVGRATARASTQPHRRGKASRSPFPIRAYMPV